MCLSPAIVTAHANINKDMWTKTQLKDGFNKCRGLQGTEAKKLHQDAGVDISDHPNTLEDVEMFARHLGVQINIVDTDYFNEIIYTSNNNANEIIYLHKNKNHHDVIMSMHAFLAKDYYCHTCKKGYTRRDKHKCPNKCLSCFKTEQHTGDKIICDKCKRTFFGHKCYQAHLRNHSKGKERDVVCELVQKCLECKRRVSDLNQHVCGYSTCRNCKEYCDLKTHECYMLSVQTKGGECTRPIPCKKLKCLCCKTCNEVHVLRF